MWKFLVIVLTGISFAAKAQLSQKDSLLAEIQKSKDDTNKVKMYEHLIYDEDGVIHTDTKVVDEKLEYAQKVLSLSQKLGYKKGIAEGYNDIGIAYMYKKGYSKSAFENLGNAHMAFEAIGDKYGVGGAMCNAGILRLRLGERKQALETLLAARDTLQAFKGSIYLAITLDKLALAYYRGKDYDNALDNFHAAKDIYEKAGKKRYLAGVYVQISEVLRKQKKYDDAVLFANKGLALAKELSDEEIEKGANNILDYIRDHK
jgi:tetratricopeptide (TPR) repeat protein